MTHTSVEGNKRKASRPPRRAHAPVSLFEGAVRRVWLSRGYMQNSFSPLFALYGPFFFPLKAVSFPSPPQLYQTPASRGKIWLRRAQKPAAEEEKRFYTFWCQMFSRESKCATVCACVSVCLNGTSRHLVWNKCRWRRGVDFRSLCM